MASDDGRRRRARGPSWESFALDVRRQIPRSLALAAALIAGCAPHGRVYMGVDKRVEAKPPAAVEPRSYAELDAALRRAVDPTLAPISAETAEQINAGRPFDTGPIRPMKPFVLKADAADRDRAVECLTEAVYYEAAREPLKGQQAVAQVVLNRVRHPAYPKTVCGVVYQGSARATGCQFTFTCDGALRWRPEPVLWRRAEAVARQALGGFVDRDVGSATHYHAAYVAPDWAPSLVKMTQVGQHIFYRWTGSWGEPAAFTGRYAGGEAVLTAAVLQSDAPVAPDLREVKLAALEGVRTYKVADLSAPNGVRTRVIGTIIPTRRIPTSDEVRQINERLAGFEKGLEAPDDPPPQEEAAKAGGD
jgi:spore germination cell wall hydrolase CwlJ-like protein